LIIVQVYSLDVTANLRNNCRSGRSNIRIHHDFCHLQIHRGGTATRNSSWQIGQLVTAIQNEKPQLAVVCSINNAVQPPLYTIVWATSNQQSDRQWNANELSLTGTGVVQLVSES
jgi:hypothetical protein